MNANGYSKMGAWSLGLSVSVGAVFFVLLPSVRAFVIAENHETSDAPGLSFLILFGGLVLVFPNLVALGLGIAGVVQRLHNWTFAFLGIILGVPVLALVCTQGTTRETPPVPPGGTMIGLPGD